MLKKNNKCKRELFFLETWPRASVSCGHAEGEGEGPGLACRPMPAVAQQPGPVIVHQPGDRDVGPHGVHGARRRDAESHPRRNPIPTNDLYQRQSHGAEGLLWGGADVMVEQRLSWVGRAVGRAGPDSRSASQRLPVLLLVAASGHSGRWTSTHPRVQSVCKYVAPCPRGAHGRAAA